MDANDRPRLILVLGEPSDLPILGVGDPNDVNELLAVEFLWVLFVLVFVAVVTGDPGSDNNASIATSLMLFMLLWFLSDGDE